MSGPLDESLSQRDWEVLATFGRTMLSAQLLEFSIFQLAQLSKKMNQRLEVALRQIEGLLKQPAADQAKGLPSLPKELKEELAEAIALRNKLAHEFLLEFRIKSAVDGKAADWGLPLLNEASEFFDSLNAKLDEHANVKLAERGIIEPFLSKPEMDDLRSSLKEWAEEMDSPDDPVSDGP